MFFIFIRACRKYRFTYVLSSHHEFSLMLRPNNTFENIEIKQEYYECNYFWLFFNAIRKMKAYRKGKVY